MAEGAPPREAEGASAAQPTPPAGCALDEREASSPAASSSAPANHHTEQPLQQKATELLLEGEEEQGNASSVQPAAPGRGHASEPPTEARGRRYDASSGLVQGSGTERDVDWPGTYGSLDHDDANEPGDHTPQRRVQPRERRADLRTVRSHDNLGLKPPMKSSPAGRKSMDGTFGSRVSTDDDAAYGSEDEEYRQLAVERATARLSETPLYIIKDEEYRQKETEESMAKQLQVMQERHEYHRQVDWLALDREAKRRARDAARECTHGPVVKPDRWSSVTLPPLNNSYYTGEHIRAEREKYGKFLNEANEKREEAARRRKAAMRYAAQTKQRMRENVAHGGGATRHPRQAASPPPRLVRRMSGPEDTTADKTFPKTKVGLFPAVRSNQSLSPTRESVLTAQKKPMEAPPIQVNEIKSLAMRASELNHTLRLLEQNMHASACTLRGSIRSKEDEPASPLGETDEEWASAMKSQSRLSDVYVESIRTKLKLLEALHAT